MSEVASLCALVLRRLQDIGVPGEAEHDETSVTISDLNEIFGEALEQFSKKSDE